ncbi:CynX/NimT family MFS transporter [Luteimonas suaedae]|uniref:CynX/NimT family MFS transporter n=1 Tax=Luteimonas suaedae TaxID=2605430 RepID=UPI0011EFAAD0|nr:MFS transporter [Luteimonas suaedae]
MSPTSPWRGRLVALAGIVLSAFNLRTAVTALTPLFDRVSADLGFGPTVIGVFGMLPTAAFALFGVVTPRIVRRIGLERTVLLAMALTAGGSLLRGVSGDTATLLAASATALAGMGVGNVVLPPLVKRYFPDRIGPLSMAYISALQVGTFVPAFLAVPLSDAFGWPASLAGWTIPAVAATVPWLVLLRRSPVASSQLPGELKVLPVAAPHRPLWRLPLAWGMALMFGMTSLATYTVFTWLPTILVGAGGDRALGGNMVGLFSLLGTVSALAMPLLAIRVQRPVWLVVACAGVMALAYLGLLFSPLRGTMLWVLLLGLGPATFPLSLTLINLRTRSTAGAAALSGFTQGVGYALACAGPLLFGWLHDLTHGWELPFAFLGLCLLVLLAGGMLVNRPRQLEDEWDVASR